MTMVVEPQLVEPQIDVTGAGFAAAVASVRDCAAGLSSSVAMLPPAAAKTVLGALAALREDIARVEVAVVAHFERLGAPKLAGARSTEAWLEAHAHKSGWAAKQVTHAVAACSASVVRDALERGDLAVEQAALLSPVVARVTDGRCPVEELAALVRAAAGQSVWHTRRAVASLVARLDDADDTPKSSHRSMTSSTTDHGTKIWRLELEPDAHAVVENAVMKLVNEVWRSGHPEGRPPTDELARLRADAMVELCRRTLHGTSEPSRSVVRSAASAEVLVVIDHDVLMGRLEGTARLADGTMVSGETARRIACDAGILPVVMNGQSEVLDLGRSKRLASVAQRRALLAAWGTCGFPDCPIPVHWTKAHHLDPWTPSGTEPGGATDLAMLLPLCERHHHVVHEGRWHITKDDRGYVFHKPDGTIHAITTPNGRSP